MEYVSVSFFHTDYYDIWLVRLIASSHGPKLYFKKWKTIGIPWAGAMPMHSTGGCPKTIIGRTLNFLPTPVCLGEFMRYFWKVNVDNDKRQMVNAKAIVSSFCSTNIIPVHQGWRKGTRLSLLIFKKIYCIKNISSQFKWCYKHTALQCGAVDCYRQTAQCCWNKKHLQHCKYKVGLSISYALTQTNEKDTFLKCNIYTVTSLCFMSLQFSSLVLFYCDSVNAAFDKRNYYSWYC